MMDIRGVLLFGLVGLAVPWARVTSTSSPPHEAHPKLVMGAPAPFAEPEPKSCFAHPDEVTRTHMLGVRHAEAQGIFVAFAVPRSSTGWQSTGRTSFVLQTDVNVGTPGCYMQKCDKKRTGFRVEPNITLSLLQSGNFGLKNVYEVDGQVYAQPLYAPGVTVDGMQMNLLVVATMQNSIYVFNADTAQLVWQNNYLTADGPVLSQDVGYNGCLDAMPYYGILSTPVLYPTVGAASTIYFVTYLKENGTLTFRLHMTDLATGSTGFRTQPFAAIGDTVAFDAQYQNQRAAVYLDNGQVFVAFASHCDAIPWWPWILSFDQDTLSQTAVYGYPPLPLEGNDCGPGIWQAGSGFVEVGPSEFVVSSGNGNFNITSNPIIQGDSVLKFGTNNSLMVLDYFAPSNQQYLQDHDLDLGSTGPVNINDKFIVQVGKQGNLYALNISNLGGYNASNNNGNAYQYINDVFIGGIWGSLGYFPAASALFGHGNADVIKRVNFNNNNFFLSNIKGSVQFPGNGEVYSPTPVVSAVNNTITSGLVYEASSSMGLTIYNSDTLATVFQSQPGDQQYCSLSIASYKPTKFQVPTVAGGSVYYGCDGAVLQYGANPKGPSLQTIQQGVKLYSIDQSVFLIVQADGNLVLYNATLYASNGPVYSASIWASNTSGAKHAPFLLSMQADCNLVLYNANYATSGPIGPNAIWSSGTFSMGTSPCALNVSGNAGGFITVNDRYGKQLFMQPKVAAYGPSLSFAGVLASGQYLEQGVRLYSVDQSVFLIVQPDGNLVLYMTALYASKGPVYSASIWASNTSGAQHAPFLLSMQADCNLVLYNANYATSGPIGPNAIWSSGTPSEGTTPCALTVSGDNGGSIIVRDAYGNVLFMTV